MLDTYVNALEKRGFTVRCFASKEEARDALLNEIPCAASVGIGGSITIEELGVEEPLRKRGTSVYWHWRESSEKRAEITLKSLLADYYLMSANAISAEGVIVNIDGTGNRVGSMILGTGKLIMVAGKNKLTEGDPIERIKTVACPKNGARLGLKTPCALTGKCMDCSSPDRMCRITVSLDNPPKGRNMEVWLVDEDLGY